MMRVRTLYVLVLLGTCLQYVTPSGMQKHTRPSGFMRSFASRPQTTGNAENGASEDASSPLVDLTGIYTGAWTRLPHPAAVVSTPHSSSYASLTKISLQPKPSAPSSSAGDKAVLMGGASGRVMLQLTSGPSSEGDEDDPARVEGVLHLSEGMLIFGPGLKRLQLSGVTTLDAEGEQALQAVLTPHTPVLLPQRRDDVTSSSNSSSSGAGGVGDSNQPVPEVQDSPLEKLLAAVFGKLGLYGGQQQQQQQGKLAQLSSHTTSRQPLSSSPWHRMSDTLGDLAAAAATAAAAEALAVAAADVATEESAAAAAPVDGPKHTVAAGGADSTLQNVALSNDAACRFRLQLTATPSGSAQHATGPTHGSQAHRDTLYQQAVQALQVATQAAAKRQRQQQQRAMLEGFAGGETRSGFVVLSWQQHLQGFAAQHLTALQQQVDEAAGGASDGSSSSTATSLPAVLLESDDSNYGEAEAVLARLVAAARASSSSSSSSDAALHKPARALLSRGFPGFNAATGTNSAGKAAAAAAAVIHATRSAFVSASSSSSAEKTLLAIVTPPQQQQQQQHQHSVHRSSSSTPQQLSLLDTWLLPCSHPLQRNHLRCQQHQQQQRQQGIVIQGLLFSDNCNASWALTAVRLPSGGLERQAMCYAVVALLVCLLQVVVVRKQAQVVANSPAAASKISLVGVCAGSQLDAFLSMAHLAAALAAPDISFPLLVVAAAQFALFAGADIALTVHVWRAHHLQQQQHRQQSQQQLLLGSNYGQAGQTRLLSVGVTGSTLEAAAAAALRLWQLQGLMLRRLAIGSSSSSSNVHNSDDGSSSIDGNSSSSSRVYATFSMLVDGFVAVLVQLVSGNSLLLLYLRFYLVLLLATALSYVLTSPVPLVLIAAYSFWIPQILHNVAATAKQPVTPAYIVACTVARTLPPLYLFSCPDNILQLPVQPYLHQGIMTWVGLQVLLLLLQHYTHPHVLVPVALRPLKYDYHRAELPWQFKQLAVKKRNSCDAKTLATLDALGQISVVHDRQCCTAVGCVELSSSGTRLQQQQHHQQHQQQQQQQQQQGVSSSSAGAGLCSCCCGHVTNRNNQQHLDWQQQQQQQHVSVITHSTTLRPSPEYTSSQNHQQQQQPQQLYSSMYPQQQQLQVAPAAVHPSIVPCSSSSTHSGCSSSDWRRSCYSFDDSLHDVVEGYDASTGEGVVECVICMAAVPLTPLQERVVTPCGHFFHPACLSQWMRVKAECPTCRWGPLPPL